MLRPFLLLALAAGLVAHVPAARAQATTCTPIKALPATITSQGNYCLANDLATSITSGRAITIATNNVTLDCHGLKLGGLSAGAGTRADGIWGSGRSNVTVRNCNIRGFYRGIHLEGGGSGHLIEDNAFNAITYTGMRIWGEGSVVRRNRIVNTGGTDDPMGTYGAILMIGSNHFVQENEVSGVASTGTQIAKGIAINGERNVVTGNRIVDLAAPPGNFVAGIMLLSGSDPTQDIVRGNSVIVLKGTQGYPIHLTEVDSSSVCRDNDLMGFDAAFLVSQGMTPIGSCTDGGGNVIE